MQFVTIIKTFLFWLRSRKYITHSDYGEKYAQSIFISKYASLFNDIDTNVPNNCIGIWYIIHS